MCPCRVGRWTLYNFAEEVFTPEADHFSHLEAAQVTVLF